MDGRTAVQGGRSSRSGEFGRFLSLIVFECQGSVLGITAKDYIFVQLDNHGLIFTVCNNTNVAVGELLLKAFFCRNGLACKIFRLADDVDVTVRSHIDYVLVICKIRVISQIVMIARCIVELGTIHGICTVFADKTGGNVLDAAIISFTSYRDNASGFRTCKFCGFPAAGRIVAIFTFKVVCPHTSRCFIGSLLSGTAGTNVGGIANRRVDITSQDLDVVHIRFASLGENIDSVVVADNIDVLGLVGYVIHIASLDCIAKTINRNALQAASFCHCRGLSQNLVIGTADLDIRDGKPFIFLADGILVSYRMNVCNRSYMLALVVINGRDVVVVANESRFVNRISGTIAHVIHGISCSKGMIAVTFHCVISADDGRCRTIDSGAGPHRNRVGCAGVRPGFFTNGNGTIAGSNGLISCCDGAVPGSLGIITNRYGMIPLIGTFIIFVDLVVVGRSRPNSNGMIGLCNRPRSNGYGTFPLCFR